MRWLSVFVDSAVPAVVVVTVPDDVGSEAGMRWRTDTERHLVVARWVMILYRRPGVGEKSFE